MVMRMLLIIATCLLWIANASVHAATLTASVDRQSVTMDEHIVFTLSLINSDTRLRAEGLSPNVDLSVLSPYFDLGTPRPDNRFTLSRRNDNTRTPQDSRAVSSITVELFPKRTGRYTLPSFQVDGQRSQPITISVMAAPSSSSPEVFVRSGVDKATAWAHEQVIIYLELWHHVNLNTASLGGDLQTSPLRIELLDYRKLMQTERKEQIAGINYHVQRMAWALFPNQNGTLTVRVPDIWTITEKGRRVRLAGKEHPIQVKALPAGIPADIMVGKPEINQGSLTALPDINSLTSWNITLRAPVMEHTLPTTLPDLIAPPQIKLYFDRALRKTEESADGVISTAHYTVSVTPLAAGEFRMPTIRLPYFDPVRGMADSIELAGQTLTVKAGPSPSAATTTLNHPQEKPQSAPSSTAWPWKMIAMVLLVLWLITLTLWLRARSANRPDNNSAGMQVTPAQPTLQEQLPARPLQTLLLEAFDSPSLEQGLNHWEEQYGMDPEVRHIVRAVQRLYYGKEERTDENLPKEVNATIRKIHTAKQQSPLPQKNLWAPESFTQRT